LTAAKTGKEKLQSGHICTLHPASLFLVAAAALTV